jgi:hypothetical protein
MFNLKLWFRSALSAARDWTQTLAKRKELPMIQLLKRLFGDNASSRSTQPMPLYSAKHPAADEISEAEKAASEILVSNVISETSGYAITERSINSPEYFHIKSILDNALQKCPDDPELIYARSSLHYWYLQGEDGMKDRENCLSLNPNHFDARMKGAHFKSWETVFHFPQWDEHHKVLPDAIIKSVESGSRLQLVRDHLRGAIALIVPENLISLDGCSKMRWELRWNSTPEGNIAAHYLFLDNGQFGEFFVPHLAEEEPTMNANYWLLRRLANEQYCFIVICRGNTVIRNERYLFPSKLMKTLSKMESDLIKTGPISSLAQSQEAAQWYMKNSDENTLKY